MTKELLLEIIDKKMFVELALIIILYLAINLVNFRLGFQFLGIIAGFRKMIPGVIIMILYNLCGRLFLPNFAYGLILFILVALLLKAIGKVTLINAFWTTFPLVLINGMGVLIIQEPLCSLNNKMTSFLLGTPYGIVIGSLIELLFPATVLLILRIYHISLKPPFQKKTTALDFLGVFLFGDILFIFYSASMQILTSFNGNSKHILILNLTLEWAAAIAGGVTFYLILTLIQKKHEYERFMFEEEKNELLNRISDLINANNNLIIDDLIDKLQDVKNFTTPQTRSNIDQEGDHPARVQLSPREKVVVELIVQGKTNKEIAADMYLSEGGVKNIITKLLDKLKVIDRTQLAVFAIENNLIKRNDF